jgi:hypothetical protein
MGQQPQFLYLNSSGWKTGKRHRIEIWFVELNGRYYVLSERKKKAHWVQNIINNPKVSFSANNRTFEGNGKIIDGDSNPKLSSDVCRLMRDKYGWDDGLIMELSPE